MDDAPNSADMLLLGAFRFDRRSYALFHLDSGAQIPIGSRALGVLGALVERAGDLVSKNEIMEEVWPETMVEDANLTVHISTLRRILDSGRSEGSCIQTVSGHGYRFVGGVAWPDPHSPFPEAQPLPAIAPLGPADFRQPAPPRRGRRWLPQVIVILVISLCLAGLGWAMLLTSDYRWSGKALPAPRLSIVVVPFTNLSDDREQQYFADGVTEDLTTDLSRIAGSFVISRNTAFTYKDKPANAKQVGRELGVRYVLEGSVRRSGKQIRVTAQLIDAETGAHLWAERFERDTGDLFALQNDITSRIAIALNYALVGTEAARPAASPAALDYLFQGRAAALRSPSPDNAAKVISLYEQAFALDPGSAEVRARLAFALSGRVLLEMSNNRAADLARAEGLLEPSPETALGHWVKGQVLRAQRRYADSIPEYEAAISLDRNLPAAYVNLGMSKLLTGSLEETIPLIERAIRLSPRDPDPGFWYDWIGLTHLLQSRPDEAIVWLEKARSASPARPFTHARLAAAYGIKGEVERAAAELADARRLSGDPATYSSIAHIRASGARRAMAPKTRALFETTYDSGLRKAGMPEE